MSESATGNTLSRLISSMCVIRSLTAVCAQSRRVIASRRRSCDVSAVPRVTHLLRSFDAQHPVRASVARPRSRRAQLLRAVEED
ncbi:hypothetical protein A5782_18820 [Mycobacterium sp. 852002-40037_SCH5390672]|nr:hypothetical protein A5782_18820 [Mycobacterium sp. 852002-40037_SCH5390672]